MYGDGSSIFRADRKCTPGRDVTCPPGKSVSLPSPLGIMSKPTYMYKLVPTSSPVPDEIPDVLPLSELDATSGFIHLSTAAQVQNTLRHFFADQDAVYVLRLIYAHVEKEIRWEDPQAKGTSCVCPRHACDG